MPTDDDSPPADSAPALAPQATMPASAVPIDPYGVFRIRSYQIYAGSWFLMTFAKQIETVVVGVYIVFGLNLGVEESSLAMGLLGLVQALPVMLLAIPGGQLADRLDRRLVLTASMTVTLFVTIGLLIVCSMHASSTWIYVLLFISAVGQALGSPSRTALLPWLVPPDRFSKAVAWSSSIFHIASMVGPAVGGLLITNEIVVLSDHGEPTSRANVSVALIVVLVCRLVALVGIGFLPSRRPERTEPSISIESLMAGVRFVWSQKVILATITLDLFAVLLGGASYLLPLYAKDVMHLPPSAVGYLRSADAAGAIFMAIFLVHLPPFRRAGRAMLWAVAGFGAATIVFGLSKDFYLSFAAMFLVGAFDNISVVVRHTLVQMLTPDSMRGRVSAVNNVFIVASNDLGGLESGLTARFFGLIGSVVGGGIGTIVVVAAAAWKWPQILALGSLGDLRPVDSTQVLRDADEELAARD